MPPASDSSRPLLFGLLALQTGLVQQGPLVAAFHAWTHDKSRSIADHLTALGHLNQAQCAVIDALVVLHLEAHQGDVQRSLAEVSVGTSTKQKLHVLGDPDIDSTLERLGSPEHDSDITPEVAVGPQRQRGARFQVLRAHARGGLGIVYVARDLELDREVALKQVLDHRADEAASRQRFVREARITGGLEHPGIVPVYSLGTYEDGRPYYAMRFIKGESLKDAIRAFHEAAALKADLGARSLELRRLLRRFTGICDAIDYAHSRGVLHRDIKPANVIVGKYGETLVVDWGLAKALGQTDPNDPSSEMTLLPSPGDSIETERGQAIGTLAFMSPEQERGDIDALGPRTDVYSLGATLYALLTGRAPFAGGEPDVRAKVQAGHFVHPRAIDPTIDPALEAVCLKAMAVRPDDRYPSARALAEDIERWAADEAVSAYHEPAWRRARRWARRHRPLVMGAAALLFASVVGLGVVLAIQTKASQDLAAANGLLREALGRERQANAELARSRSLAHARFELANAAIETYHTGVTEDFILKQDQFRGLRDSLLMSAADFYRKLEALLRDGPEGASRRAMARASFQLAEINAKVGRQSDALAEHQRVLADREALAATGDPNAALVVELAESEQALGALAEERGDTDQAIASFRRAASRIEGLPNPDPDAKVHLAECRSRLGKLLFRSRDRERDQALDVCLQARADLEALVDDPAVELKARRLLQSTVSQVAIILERSNDLAGAEREYRRALDLSRELASDDTAPIEDQARLAMAHNNVGWVLSRRSDLDGAELAYRDALAVCERLLKQWPGIVELRRAHGFYGQNLGNVLDRSGRVPQALEQFQATREIFERLTSEVPTNVPYRDQLALSHNNIATSLEKMNRLGEAEVHYREALRVRRGLVELGPKVRDYWLRLAIAHQRLSSLLSRTERADAALDEQREALVILRRLADEDPNDTDTTTRLAQGHHNLGNRLRERGALAEAEVAYLRARDVHQRLADRNPGIPLYRSNLAGALGALAVVQLERGHADQAEAAFREVLAIQKRLAADYPRERDFQFDIADTHNNLAVLLVRTRRGEVAEVEARAALAVHQALATDRPENQLGLAQAFATLGDVLHARGQDATAVETYEQAMSLLDGLIASAANKETLARDERARSLRRRALAHRALGQLANAATDTREALAFWDSLPSRDGRQWFESACAHATLAALAGEEGTGVATDQRERERETALANLQNANRAGRLNLLAIQAERALETLQELQGYQSLLKEIAGRE